MTSGKLLLGQDATRLFLHEIGIEVDPIRELEDFKKACEQANPRYQGGRDLVRFQLEQDTSTWPAGVRYATMNFALRLGMTSGETPLNGEWDLIIALGGARRSPLHRACYAAQAIAESRAGAGILAVAGSTRLLNDIEKSQVQDFAPNAETEYDLCVGAMNQVKKRYPKLTVAAICKDDPKSGNDGVIDQTIDALSHELAIHKPLRVASVTTRIYVIGMELDMARAAKRHGWRGYAAAGHSSDPEMVFNRTISTYLSECLTTLRKAAIAAAESC